MYRKWIMHGNTVDNPRYRIFLFHHAGGNASFFSTWKDHVNKYIEVCPVQLPMRENRINESMPDSIVTIAKQFVSENIELFDRPFICFGHSMGAAIAYEVVCELERLSQRGPLALFVSASNPPKAVGNKEYGDMNDEKLIKILRGYGLIEDKILENQEFLEFYLPIARADFNLCAYYCCRRLGIKRINCPIHVLSGNQDYFVNDELLDDWGNYTYSMYSKKIFAGKHFYITEHIDQICSMMNRIFEMFENNIQY